MGKTLLKKYAYDIALDQGVGAHLVSLVTGLMVFFVTLALVANVGLNGITQNWVTGLSGTLTVEIRAPMPGPDGVKPAPRATERFNERSTQILSLLKTSPHVAEARRLTDAEIRSLIEPWMGDNAALDNLPLPALIDVKLNEDADIAKLQSSVRVIEPAAVFNTHTDTLDDVKALVKTAILFVFLLTGVIMLLAVVAISGIVRAKLLIHQPEVETLHLIGASDEYIASQFRQHTLKGTLKGAVIGLVATFVTLFLIGAITRAFDINVLSGWHFPLWQWALLALTPIAAGSMIAHLTAQATALKELSRLP